MLASNYPQAAGRAKLERLVPRLRPVVGRERQGELRRAAAAVAPVQSGGRVAADVEARVDRPRIGPRPVDRHAGGAPFTVASSMGVLWKSTTRHPAAPRQHERTLVPERGDFDTVRRFERAALPDGYGNRGPVTDRVDRRELCGLRPRQLPAGVRGLSYVDRWQRPPVSNRLTSAFCPPSR